MSDAVRRLPSTPRPTGARARARPPAADPGDGLRGEDRLLRDLFERGGLHDHEHDHEALHEQDAFGVPLPVVLPRSLQGLPLPGLGGSPATAAVSLRAERALQQTFGADVDAMVLSSGVSGGRDGKVHVEAFVAGGTVSFTLGKDKAGKDVVQDLAVAEPPMLTDPVQQQELEAALAAAGRPGAAVRAVADGDPFSARTTVVVQEGDVQRALVVDRGAGAPTAAPLSLHDAGAEDEARALALPLAIDAALAAARRRGAVPEVRVYVRAEQTTPSDLIVERRAKTLAFTAKGLLDGADVRVVFDKAKASVRVEHLAG
jgi:hypothetical protein